MSKRDDQQTIKKQNAKKEQQQLDKISKGSTKNTQERSRHQLLDDHEIQQKNEKQ